MTPEERRLLQATADAIYAMVNALGAALPMTPALTNALDKLVQADMAVPR